MYLKTRLASYIDNDTLSNATLLSGSWLKDVTDILVLTHLNPDGDSVGAVSAFTSFCNRLKKKNKMKIKNVFCGGISEIPNSFNFLSSLGSYKVLDSIPESILYNENALVVCLDSSSGERCIPDYENFKRIRKCKTINIDHHHLINTKFADLNYVYDASSCCELVAEIIGSISIAFDLMVSLSENEAYSLYTGMRTDTGNFTYSSVNSKTFAHAEYISMFLDNGKISEIDEKLSKNKHLNYPSVLSKILNSISYQKNNEVAILNYKKEFADGNVTVVNDFRHAVYFPLQVIPVKISILIIEVNNYEFEISIRSKPDASMSARQIAIELGGNGHELAAGAIYHGSYSELHNKLSQYLNS